MFHTKSFMLQNGNIRNLSAAEPTNADIVLTIDTNIQNKLSSNADDKQLSATQTHGACCACLKTVIVSCTKQDQHNCILSEYA